MLFRSTSITNPNIEINNDTKFNNYISGEYIDGKPVELIKDGINKNSYIDNNDNISYLIICINRLIYSKIINLNIDRTKLDDNKVIVYDKFLSTNNDIILYNIPTTSTTINKIFTDVINENTIISPNFRTFLIMVKCLFIEDKTKIDNKIIEIEKILENMVYNYDSIDTNFTNPTNFYNNFLNINYSKDIDITSQSELVKVYKRNKLIIKKILNIYKQMVLSFRSNVIYMLNVTDNYCKEDDNIDINAKLYQFMNKIFNNSRNTFDNDNYHINYKFKTQQTQQKIEIYKKNIQINLNKINLSLIKHLNVIKYLMSFISPDTDEPNSLNNIIINNYNYFNTDNKKHLTNNLLEKSIKINNKIGRAHV